MADSINTFRTSSGDLPVNYEALANLPKINGEELRGDMTIEASVTEEDKQAIVEEILVELFDTFTDASEVPM